MAAIVVFDNGSYVDTAGFSSSESDNTQAALADAGHAVTTFTALDGAGITAALAGKDAVVIPEMEISTWIPDAGATASLQGFVNGGGTLVIHGWGGNQAGFLNSVFGLSVSETALLFTPPFAATGSLIGGPATLPWNDATEGLDISSLPGGSTVFYGNGTQAVMADIPYGGGSILYVGWDFYDAQPVGSLDGGWLAAYALALTEVIDTNEAPDAVDDVLVGTVTGALRVGYYDMDLGQGSADQIEAIEAAGHIAVLMTDLSDAELADIDMLLVQNPSNFGYSAEYVSRLAAIDLAVQNGLALLIHDRYVDTAETILPGSAGFTITGGLYGTEINFIDDFHSIALGPNGALNDGSLDGGNFSTHGFAVGGTLPGDADLILSTGDAGNIVTFSYGHGLGSVVYSSIPLDFYLAGDTVGAGAANMAGQAEEYAANLIDYAAAELIGGSLTDEDSAIVINGADLLANDTDPDGDTLEITAVSVMSTLGVGLILNPDGSISYDPSGVLDYLDAGEVVEDTFEYTISDGNGGTDTATVSFTVLGVNDTPDAVDDDLTPSGGVLQIGYYDMELGQGNATQIEAILAAGHIPVLITDLSDPELASIDMLLVQNPSNFGYNAEYLGRLAAIDLAVQNGLELVIHDRYVHTAESILPGSAGFTITGGVFGTEIEFIDDAHSVASGPGGALDDASLDGGNFSTHGFSIGGTLPGDADLILSTGNPDEIVTFSYSHGLGSVVYSTIPLDFYLAGDTNGAGGNTMSGKAEEYAANLLNHVAVDLNVQTLTDEDTAVTINGADLLANDTDPDGDTLTISAVSALSSLGGAVTLNLDGTIDYDPSGALDYLAEGEVVEDTFTYTVDDGNGGTDTATVRFNVVGINDAPSAPVDTDGPSGASISEHLVVGSIIGLDANSTDPEGDTVSYSFGFDLLGDPILVDGHFTIDPVTGVVTLSSAVNFELDNSHSLTIYASDGSASSSTEFTVDVTNVVEHLFTPFNDGTEANPIDFNALPDGAYDFDGAQYDALAGNDWVILPDEGTVDAGNPWDYGRTFNASAGNDVVQGGDGDDIISGGEGNDWLFGADGDDRLVGSSGNDILAGGDGSDKLTGSSGKDIFIFTDSELGTTKLGEHDTITDFKQGEDKIDISALFDVGTFAGIKAGQLTGANASSIYKVAYYTESGKTWVQGDTTGDGMADFAIELSGSYKLKGNDLLVANSVIGTQAAWVDATGPALLDYAQFHNDYFF